MQDLARNAERVLARYDFLSAGMGALLVTGFCVARGQDVGTALWITAAATVGECQCEAGVEPGREQAVGGCTRVPCISRWATHCRMLPLHLRTWFWSKLTISGAVPAHCCPQLRCL